MRKSLYYLLFIAALVIVLPASAWAHTGLKTSNPADGDVVTASLAQLELTFNTVIEPLSALTVTNEGGEEIPVRIETGNNEMKGVFEQPLENGTYTVKWRIIGEDSHNVDGSYTFKVERQATASAGDAADGPTKPSTDAGSETSADLGGNAADASTTTPDAATSGQTEADAGAKPASPAEVEQTEPSGENNHVDTANEQPDAAASDAASDDSISGSTILWSAFGVLLLGGFIFGVVRIASKS